MTFSDPLFTGRRLAKSGFLSWHAQMSKAPASLWMTCLTVKSVDGATKGAGKRRLNDTCQVARAQRTFGASWPSTAPPPVVFRAHLVPFLPRVLSSGPPPYLPFFLATIQVNALKAYNQQTTTSHISRHKSAHPGFSSCLNPFWLRLPRPPSISRGGIYKPVSPRLARRNLRRGAPVIL